MRLPRHDDPKLSAVMVTHGAWRLVEQAIGALIEHTQVPFELIVVDNASTDGTAAHVSALDGARVILNDHNPGFGPATNQGAKLARGECLVLLNSDAFVHPKWSQPLLETLAQPSVGAVVPRYLDGTGLLQEAGGLLARDGNIYLYGAGDDPNRGCYRFRRTVDYGSAVCMLIRRKTFASLGGFDDVYAPAYYEDTDLCLRLADRGMAVVYEPRSTVTHIRWGSGAQDDAAALSERNRKLFTERWGARLAARPQTFTTPSDQTIIRARDVLASPRLLICADTAEPSAQRVVGDLLDDFPHARLTWVAPAGSANGVRGDRWLAQGVELLDDPDHSWLDQRLFHYDAVLRGREMTGRILDALERTQPQAPQIALHQLAGMPEELALALAAAGVAPPGRFGR